MSTWRILMMGMLRKMAALPGRLRSRHIWRLGVLAVTMIVVIMTIVFTLSFLRSFTPRQSSVATAFYAVRHEPDRR